MTALGRESLSERIVSADVLCLWGSPNRLIKSRESLWGMKSRQKLPPPLTQANVADTDFRSPAGRTSVDSPSTFGCRAVGDLLTGPYAPGLGAVPPIGEQTSFRPVRATEATWYRCVDRSRIPRSR